MTKIPAREYEQLKAATEGCASRLSDEIKRLGYSGSPRLGEGKFIRINRIRSHAGIARWRGEAEPTGEYLARVQTEEIPSPYAYSPSVMVYDWKQIPVVMFETSHKVYDIFSIPTNLLRFKTDDEATDWQIKYGRKVA